VTGSLGGAAAELAALATDPELFRDKKREDGQAPHLFPEPRVKQGIWLRKHGIATAAMDLSDGLSTDLAHLCQESNVAAEIDASAFPLGAGATLEMALHGGEDYELLFTARKDTRVPKEIAGIRVSEIGRVRSARSGRPSVGLRTPSGLEPLAARGWEHFSGAKT
jgi:thiamine-monophosphate kinase